MSYDGRDDSPDTDDDKGTYYSSQEAVSLRLERGKVEKARASRVWRYDEYIVIAWRQAAGFWIGAVRVGRRLRGRTAVHLRNSVADAGTALIGEMEGYANGLGCLRVRYLGRREIGRGFIRPGYSGVWVML